MTTFHSARPISSTVMISRIEKFSHQFFRSIFLDFRVSLLTLTQKILTLPLEPQNPKFFKTCMDQKSVLEDLSHKDCLRCVVPETPSSTFFVSQKFFLQIVNNELTKCRNSFCEFRHSSFQFGKLLQCGLCLETGSFVDVTAACMPWFESRG